MRNSMSESTLLNEMIAGVSSRRPEAVALVDGKLSLSYGVLDAAVTGFASGLMALGVLILHPPPCAPNTPAA